MSIRTYGKYLTLFAAFIGIVILIGDKGFTSTHAQETAMLDSPLPTPIPVISEYGQKALAFVVEKYAVPVEYLLIEYELETDYPLSGRTFRHFLISDTHDPHWTTYSVSIEIRTGAIEEDMTVIERAEETAYLAKYGKVEPALWKRLQQAPDDTVLSVAIWAAGKPLHKAIANGTKPMDVENSETAAKIQARYEELLRDNLEARLEPVEAWLNQEGYRFERMEGMPSLTALLPKSSIQKLAQMAEVGLIYLIEEKGTPGLDIAAASDRVNSTWQRGFTGNGVRVAVLDQNRINSPCLNIVATKDAALPLADHATKVANIVACNSDPYRGIAYNASIVDGGSDITQVSAINSLKWATESPQSAKVVNVSVGWELDGDIRWLDRAFDYWVRTRYFTTAILSHNQNSYVRTPGKAWNVITVGGSNDQGNANWSDDSMYNNSNYIDPTGGESGTDREKPEVAAPAVGITTANGDAAGANGTSYAAPQVAGLAALLLHRNSQLQTWPEAVKAIIMASAVHNVDGPSDIDLTQDLKDGAGVIDAALADQVAQLRQTSPTDPCATPCWWGITTSSSSPAIGNSVDRYFNATRGERIRVVAVWMSNADTETNNYSFDRLDTNFDLRVYTSGGALIKSATSIKNNYELVDFIAPETTTYRIGVRKQSATENNNSLGIAFVKLATYLPDIRRNTADGWTSSIYVRNDDAEPRSVKVTFFNTDGSFNSDTSTTLNPDALWINPLPPNNWQGSAIVEGNEEVSVVVAQERSGTYTHEAYPGVGNPATSVRVPIFQKNNSGYFSDLFVQNAGTIDIKVDLQFIASTGSSPTCNDFRNITVKPGAAFKIPASDLNTTNSCDVGTTFIGSVQVSNSENQPLAIASTQYKDSGGVSDLFETSNTQLPATSLYAPLVQNNNSGYISGLVLSRTSGGSFNVRYYNKDTGAECTNQLTLGNNPQVILPAPPTGNPCPTVILAKFDSASPLVANVNQLKTGAGATTYAAIANPSRVAILAKVRVDSGWSDGFVIANYNSVTANVTVRLYNANGTLNSTPINNQALDANRSRIVLGTFPANFNGSAVITADQPVAVIANSGKSGAGDTLGSYPANHR